MKVRPRRLAAGACRGLPLLLASWLTAASASAGPAPAPPPTDAGAADLATVAVSVEADRSQAKLGEPIVLTIRIQGGVEAADWGLPAALDLDPFVELGRERSQETRDGRPVQALRLRVAVFERLGQLQLSGIKLVSGADGSAGRSLDVPPIQIQILSVLEGVDDPLPRDVAGPVEVTVPDHRLLVVFGLVGCWFLLGLVLRRQALSPHLTARLQALPPPRQAHEIALAGLQRVLDQDLLRQGAFHSYFTQISEVVREYLGNRYAFYALDLTSCELIAELRDRITPGLDLAVLEKLLGEADLVKFARLQPSAPMCSHAINSAYAIIEATRLRESEAQAGAVA